MDNFRTRQRGTGHFPRWRVGLVSGGDLTLETVKSRLVLVPRGSRKLNKMRTRRVHAGLSLLEVILAIAILGGSIAVIGELVRLGVRQAEEARELTTAQLLCESKIEEIAAGAATTDSVSNSPCETDPRWQYSVTVSQIDQTLLEVRVTVEQVESARLQPLSVSLVRWMVNPSLTSSQSSGTSGTAASGAPSSTSTTQGQTKP
jgi:type II secretory pathway pseudopilin PulG